MELEAEQKLPPLRVDLQIFRGTRDWHGQPNWVIFDPVRNSYFQLDEKDFRILSHWSSGTPAAICDAVRSAGEPVDFEDVARILQFLLASQLLDSSWSSVRKRLAVLASKQVKSPWQKLLHNYLFVRIPLVRPDAFLDWLYPRVRWIFTRIFLTVSLISGIIGLGFISLRWEQFSSSFLWFFSVEGFAALLVTLLVVKIIHELAHALACKHFGVTVPTMGVAFLVMWPVLYTDASNSWRLSSRRQRALIDSAGVIAELTLACYAMVLWFFLPEGLLKSVAFTVATTTWILSLLVNLNPFMRFDGYFFLSDILNIPNLQQRSFALAKWQFREWLFRSGVTAPETLPNKLRSFLVFFAYGVWIYRFFLFLGIALLVYHFFFKALGIFLFLVEIWWFILRPLWNEISEWPPLFSSGDVRRRFLGPLLVFWAVFVFFFPWQRDALIPAQFEAVRSTSVFSPENAYLQRLLVSDGQKVSEGQRLVELTAPEIEHEATLARLRIMRLEAAIDENAASGTEQFSERLILEQQLAQAQSELDSLRNRIGRLTIRATHAGTIRDVLPELHESRWVNKDMRLFQLVDPREARVIAWVDENLADQLKPGDIGFFYPANNYGPSGGSVELVSKSSSSLGILDDFYHASIFGGDIAVRQRSSNELVPEVSVYPVIFRWKGDYPTDSAQSLRGWVSIDAGRRSFAGQVFTWMLAGLIRESSF